MSLWGVLLLPFSSVDGRENFWIGSLIEGWAEWSQEGARSRGAILESLSKNVHERRTSTGSGFVFLGSDLLTFSGNSSRVKTLNKTNVVASRHTKREEASLPVNLRHPKTSLLKLPIDPIDHFEVVRGTGTVLCRSASWDCFRNAIVSYWLV